DDMALAALRVLRESGRRVPEDVALVGYDDTALAASADPPLTTVHQPTERMGGEMARVLADRALARTAPEGIVLETRLVVRASGRRRPETAPVPLDSRSRRVQRWARFRSRRAAVPRAGRRDDGLSCGGTCLCRAGPGGRRGRASGPTAPSSAAAGASGTT